MFQAFEGYLVPGPAVQVKLSRVILFVLRLGIEHTQHHVRALFAYAGHRLVLHATKYTTNRVFIWAPSKLSEVGVKSYRVALRETSPILRVLIALIQM